MLLPGDLDEVGLDNLIESGVDAKASIAVFPHHGGTTGKGDMATFASRYCNAVEPENVIFSIGRGRYNTPRPEIVDILRRKLPKSRVLCTQLSEHCAGKVPNEDPAHLTDKASRGRELRKCCAGTIVITLGKAAPTLFPILDTHSEFIARAAPTALCMRPMQQS